MRPHQEIDLRLQSPFTALVCGPTGSGKTELLFSLIRRVDEIASPTPVEIIYCYGVWQRRFEDYKDKVRFHSGLIDVEMDIERDGKNRWLIIDDLMGEVGGKETTNAIFTKFSHHLNISVFFLLQNLFPKDNRTVSINSQYFFLFKNPRDGMSVTNLAKQAFPQSTRAVQEAFSDATRKPHSFLFLNLRQETPEWARLIGNFASEHSPMTVYIPNTLEYK